MNFAALLEAAGTEPCRPWPRRILARTDWAALATALQADPRPSLLALWADTVQVHALLLDEAAGSVTPVSVAVENGRYPALSRARPAATWFERMIHDLWGHVPDGAVDMRPWLDHGRWPHAQPLAPRPAPLELAARTPEFLPSGDADLMQIPLGPVRNGIGEAVHLRLTVHGHTVLRAETRLGYAHKGTLSLMRGKSPRAAARFAARLAGDATVAHSLAFARATEAACEVTVPPRAAVLRTAMLELERIGGDLDVLAGHADAAGMAALHGSLTRHREHLLRGIAAVFGHRLMMDSVVPGGLAADIAPGATESIMRPLADLETALPGLHRTCDRLLARLRGLGVVTADAARAWAAGGSLDVRQFDATCPPRQAVRHPGGDAAARGRFRLAEIADSTRMVRRLLENLPEGPVSAALPNASGEGVGCAESVRGGVWHWLRLDHGQIAAIFPRDPGWALGLLADLAAAGARAEDVETIMSSFGLAASPVDL